jgi:NADH-quinone oxidoreductase subunit J
VCRAAPLPLASFLGQRYLPPLPWGDKGYALLMIELIIFVLMAVAALVGAVAVIRARNTVYAAMGLLGTLLAVAVLYVVQLAHMVAAVQVIVYAGAVMTLFLFVIMLVGVDRNEDTRETIPNQRRLTIGLVGVLFVVIGFVVVSGSFDWIPVVGAPADPQLTNGTVQRIAGELFTGWVLAFEATALLLTIAAVGAIALASTRRRRQES